MLSLDYRVERTQSAVLVSCVLTNDHERPVVVRVNSRLDSPVLPPRRCGKPAAGWTASGYEGVVSASGRLTIGYACSADEIARPSLSDPSSPRDTSPPVSVEATPVVDDCDDDCDDTSVTPVDVKTTSAVSEEPNTTNARRTPVDELLELGDPRPPATVIAVSPEQHPTETGRATKWLDAIERRLGRCERVIVAKSVPRLTRVLDEIGGIDGLDRTLMTLELDRAALRCGHDETRRREGDELLELRERVDRVLSEIPYDTLEVFA